jgi:hypothetical protein
LRVDKHPLPLAGGDGPLRRDDQDRSAQTGAVSHPDPRLVNPIAIRKRTSNSHELRTLVEKLASI